MAGLSLQCSLFFSDSTSDFCLHAEKEVNLESYSDMKVQDPDEVLAQSGSETRSVDGHAVLNERNHFGTLSLQ